MMSKKFMSVLKNLKTNDKCQNKEKIDVVYDPDWSELEGRFTTDEDYEKSYESKFLEEMLGLLLEYIRKSRNNESKVLDFHHPHQLKEAIGSYIDIPSSAKDLEQVLSDCKDTLKYCVKTGHPRFFNQLSCGLDTIALAGEFLTSTTNSNMFTYEIAPVFTLMEEVTLQKLRDYVGWSSGDGIFTPGGALANLYAVLAARHCHYNKVKVNGLFQGPRMIIFTSEHAHFSIKRAAIICGLGLNQVKLIKCDDRGKLIVSNLIKEINESLEKCEDPFMVCATGGTTVLGAFDPIEDIDKVCKEYRLWLHVDCAWGGGALLSKEHRHLLAGIEQADSVTWNPHKAMGVTLQCSTILLKNEGILEESNGLQADYLFQKDKSYDESFDTGDKAIQCGRRNDVFKLWLMWRAKGDQGFQDQINRLFNLTTFFCNLLDKKNGFEMVLQKPEYLNICFWYIPQAYREIKNFEERKKILTKVTAGIKAKMMVNGTTMVGYQPLLDKPNFFRMIISNPSTTESDLEFLINEIIKLGEELNEE